MILKKLTIKNLFAYRDQHELDFELGKKQNIILILARNGRGKTSFLRIVRILIHGIRNNKDILEEGLSEREYVVGKSTQWRGIFNADALDKGQNSATVDGVLELEGKELRIHRRFVKDGGGFQEQAIISYDGQERNEDFLENILPKNFAQFFFFDGEKIESLINTKNINVEDSLKTLLNIKAYERLIDGSNIARIKRDFNADVQDAPTAEQIKKIDAEILSIQANLEYLQAEINTLQKQIKQKNNEIERVRDKVFGLKSTDAPNLQVLKKDLERKNKELTQIRKSLNDKVKNNSLFIMMAHDLAKEYLDKLNDDNVNYQLDEQLIRFKKLLNKIKNSIFEEDFDEEGVPPEHRLGFHTQEFYQERIDKVYKKFTKDDKRQMEQQVIYFYEDDKKLLQDIFQQEAFTRKELQTLKTLTKDVEALKDQVETSQGDDDEKQQKLDGFKKELATAEAERSQLEQTIGSTRRQHAEGAKRKTDLENQIIDLKNQFAIAKPVKQALDLTERTIDFFNEFIDELLKSKVNALQKEFSQTLRKLLPDDRIYKVKIDNRFNIKIYNKSNKEQAIGSLSSGQKQIVATSLMQAISKVAKVDAFVCVDTPLARIDKLNRERIIKHYYPQAANQVIILATDSEIAPKSDEYQYLKPHLAKEYTILNSYENRSSYFKEGYVEEK
nr:AAA family ATPase [uncultured Microscilla sp.]